MDRAKSAQEERASRGLDLDQLSRHFHQNLTSKAREYLWSRGLSDEIINKYQVGYEEGSSIGFDITERQTVLSDYFEGRIIFPIKDASGRTVDLVGRSLDGSEPKYKSLLGSQEVLYNEGGIHLSDVIFLCEGIIDVLTLVQNGMTAVGVLGATNFGAGHAQKLKGKRVFVCFGNDDAGIRNRERVAGILSQTADEVCILSLPQGIKDVNDFFLRVPSPQHVFLGLVQEAARNGRYDLFRSDTRLLVPFFHEVVKRRAGRFSGISTGLEPLDNLLFGGLREGLYVVCGEPSTGKTTLLRQMADHAAASGTPVLFVTLEMSAFELWARSISRILGVPASEIVTGRIDPGRLEEANREYAETAKNICTIEGEENTSVPAIALLVERTMNATGRRPVVFIDYLQRIPAFPHGRGDRPQRGGIGETVLLLKRLARRYSIAVVVSSSLQRNTTPESRNGYRLSGHDEVEWTADFLLRLRLPEEVTSGDSDCSPVVIEVLKNRNGPLSDFRVEFCKSIGLFRVPPPSG